MLSLRSNITNVVVSWRLNRRQPASRFDPPTACANPRRLTGAGAHGLLTPSGRRSEGRPPSRWRAATLPSTWRSANALLLADAELPSAHRASSHLPPSPFSPIMRMYHKKRPATLNSPGHRPPATFAPVVGLSIAHSRPRASNADAGGAVFGEMHRHWILL